MDIREKVYGWYDRNKDTIKDVGDIVVYTFAGIGMIATAVTIVTIRDLSKLPIEDD